MLTFIGAGLSDVQDLTLKGLVALKSADSVYLDAYTSIMTNCQVDLEQLIGKSIQLADRDMVEQQADKIIGEAEHGGKVAFVVIGDPLSATTHTDLWLRAIERNVECRIIHNTSIMTAVGCCGLQLYSFGSTVSIPLWVEGSSAPSLSFYDKILDNFERGLHTLCLLDIKVKERSMENLCRDLPIFEPPRFMLCREAARQIVEAADSSVNPSKLDPASCLAIGLARVGSPTQSIVVSTLADMASSDETSSLLHNEPLHSLIIPGRLHVCEQEFLSAGLLLKSSTSSSNLPVIVCGGQSSMTRDEVDTLFSTHQRAFR